MSFLHGVWCVFILIYLLLLLQLANTNCRQQVFAVSLFQVKTYKTTLDFA
eukprot:m.293078 g.293078  ORF g.293078 m.293078 type:complete len:50 (+) comp19489_c5_seq1:51-200(+)